MADNGLFTKSFTFDADTAERLEQLAALTDRSASAMVRWLINKEYTTLQAQETLQQPQEQQK